MSWHQTSEVKPENGQICLVVNGDEMFTAFFISDIGNKGDGFNKEVWLVQAPHEYRINDKWSYCAEGHPDFDYWMPLPDLPEKDND